MIIWSVAFNGDYSGRYVQRLTRRRAVEFYLSGCVTMAAQPLGLDVSGTGDQQDLAALSNENIFRIAVIVLWRLLWPWLPSNGSLISFGQIWVQGIWSLSYHRGRFIFMRESLWPFHGISRLINMDFQNGEILYFKKRLGGLLFDP